VTAMAMNVAIRSAIDVMLERDPDVVVFGEDVGIFRRRLPSDGGSAGQVRHHAGVRHPDRRRRHHRRGRRAWGPTGCGRSSRSSSPTTSTPASIS
jgi:hypothetical protein